MTLLGAVKTDVELLIAADSAFIGGPPAHNIPGTKLYTSTSTPLFVWGYCGDQPAGEQFKVWLDQQTFSSWEEAVQAMADELAAQNGVAAARAATAGAAATHQGTDVVAVASAFGEAHVLYIDDEAGPTYKDGGMFIGHGCAHAMAAWTAARKLTNDPAAAFRAAVEAAVEVTIGLGHPPQFETVRI